MHGAGWISARLCHLSGDRQDERFRFWLLIWIPTDYDRFALLYWTELLESEQNMQIWREIYSFVQIDGSLTELSGKKQSYLPNIIVYKSNFKNLILK